MDVGLSGQAAIITGGASGIGRAVSEALGRCGVNVLLRYFASDGGAAETVVFLASPLSSFLTGEPIEVNGGHGLF